ncbi:hypothetical protein V7S43_003118 [Phytophthora oleae]|uniref:Uncharacterized protein n=1 Tax=Phytophthora oleae TaxID=2107226 RepID=A0ABD3G1L6_9STRA
MGGGIKKAVKSVEASELLFVERLDAIFSLRIKRVALVFGPSIMSPREVHVVDFNEVQSRVSDAEPSTTASPDTDGEDMSLEDSQTLLPPSLPMTREKLMRLCAQKLMRAVFTNAVEQFSGALSATKLHVTVLAERQSTRIPGFLPKQQFKLRLPKDKNGARTHYITISDGLDSSEQASECTNNPENGWSNESVDNAAEVSADANFVWYLLELPIPVFFEVINTLDSH